MKIFWQNVAIIFMVVFVWVVFWKALDEAISPVINKLNWFPKTVLLIILGIIGIIILFVLANQKLFTQQVI